MEEALVLAVNQHKGQVRKGADEPYAFHPIRVALYFTHESSLHRIVALLHDVFEDTPLTLEQFAEQFDLARYSTVVKALDAITRKGSSGQGESHAEYIERLATQGGAHYDIAVSVKLADLKDNMRDPWHCPRGMMDRYSKAYQRLHTVAKERGLLIP